LRPARSLAPLAVDEQLPETPWRSLGGQVQLADALAIGLPSAGERRAAADRMAARLASANEKLGVAAGRLEALSPLRVLARGYAIVNKEGETAPVTDAADLAPGDDVRLQLARGRAAARILSTETE